MPIPEDAEISLEKPPELSPEGSPAALAARQIAARIAAASPGLPEPEGPAGLLLLVYLREQFLVLLAQDPRVRADRSDAVHKMRVSTRRMRSALASYRKVLAPEPARAVRSELKWLAGVLGAARDAQVLRARLHALLDTQPADLVLGPVRQRIDEELLGDYRSAHAEVIRVLDDDRYRHLLEEIEVLITRPDFTPAASEPAAETAGRMLRRDRKRLHRQVRDARAARTEDHRAESLHEARKDAKRLRYAAEVAQPVSAPGAADLITGAEHVQKILGEHQDSVVSREYLRRLGAAAAAAAGSGHNGFTYGRLHALEEEHGEAAHKRFRKAWVNFPRLA